MKKLSERQSERATRNDDSKAEAELREAASKHVRENAEAGARAAEAATAKNGGKKANPF